MADIDTIADELKERLATVDLPSGDPLRVGDLIVDQVNVPCALVGPDNPFIDWDLTNARGADTFFFRVVLLASRASERAGANLINALLAGAGASSVKAALEASWPDAVSGISFAEAQRVEDYGVHTWNDVEYLGCVFIVMVVAT